LHGLHGFAAAAAQGFAAQGLQELAAAQGLHGLQGLAAAQGFWAAAVWSRGTTQSLAPAVPWAAQGLHGLQGFAAAQGLHGLHGLAAAATFWAAHGLAGMLIT
jgi:hypothetical protein